MPTDHRAKLATIKRFDQLIAYLRDEMGWPIESGRDFEELTFEYTPDELGIDLKTAAKIQEIKRLRPLSSKQPWGIFFVKFEPKRLPVVALRRILGQVALKKRASANSAERAAWAADDLLFISNYGEGDERQISFAHFSSAQDGKDLPTLKVLGWDNRDTALHLDAVAKELTENLTWPEDDRDAEAWRNRWRGAFTLGHRQVVTTSKGLSIRLAELARAIRDRIKTALAIETKNGPLTRLMKAFQTALVHDLDADGFADMYAQTIAYGLLSARIADPHRKTADDFAAHMRTNPFLRELMETFLKVGGRRGKAGGPGIDFDELGVSDVVELLDDANMEAVVRDFGDRNPQEDPVIHFYELFLTEYDAKKRMQRGVFYTPRPVVSFIVRSVDELLRTEFGLADGLADTSTWGEVAKRHKDMKIPAGVSPDQDFVQILDPATGTGTFLVEAIDLIHKTLVAKWKAQGHGEKKIDAVWNEYVPKHLLTRLHGYELLMAPYAIAHLKIGLKLYETGYRFGSEERARIYLTNALEPAHDFSGTLEFAIPALAHEAQAVNEVKRGERFTVVVGNPPYSNYGQLNRVPYILGLLEDYKRGLDEKKINLDDDFIKFVRFAQVQVERAHVGTVAMITNNVFIDGLTHRRMRQSLMETFRRIRILDLHGNSSAKETANDGSHDENVFDITQGVAISLLCRTPNEVRRAPSVSFADIRGLRSVKYAQLLKGGVSYVTLDPAAPHYFFTPKDLSLSAEYEAFASLADVFCKPSYGIQTKRDGLTIAFEDGEILRRGRFLLNHSDAAVRSEFDLAEDGRDWAIKWARADLARLKNLGSNTRRVLYRPFDVRWTIYTDKSKGFLAYPRWESMRCMLEKNVALIAMRQVFQDTDEYSHVGVTNLLIDERTFYSNRGGTYLFPLYLSRDEGHGLLTKLGGLRQHNLSPNFLSRIGSALAIRSSDAAGVAPPTPEDVFHYLYATLSSRTYRIRYVELLRIGYPRVPLPGSSNLFRALARLGDELTALQLLESPKLAQPITVFIGDRNPEVEKISWSENVVWLDKAQTSGFKGVREDVWNFHVGGYQVCEKWLKDRKGRVLSKDDIAHYHKIVVALSETIRLMKEIDEVIEQHGGWPTAFQTGEAKPAPVNFIPFRPRTVVPTPAERYVNCAPLVPLKAAAGAFSDPQQIEDDGFEWVDVNSRHRLRKGMFVAQVVGKSMEPAIPDGAWCLFRAPVEGTREGKTVLVQLRESTDPETGQRYTVKRYESVKAVKGDSWSHAQITLEPLNPDFEPIVLTGASEGQLNVVAEFVEVLRSSGDSGGGQ